MISQLRGVIIIKQPPLLVLDVNGVGYEIDAPMSTFYRMPEIGQTFTVLTQFIVREDAHHLYGFATSEEKNLFRTLLKVNGVGPRLALTILSSVEPDAFVRCVMNKDTDSLVKLPGVGKKTAERLVIEMRDKLSGWEGVTQLEGSLKITTNDSSRNQSIQDAISALVSLGYKPQEASRAISKVDDGQINSEDMIRRALREMMV